MNKYCRRNPPLGQVAQTPYKHRRNETPCKHRSKCALDAQCVPLVMTRPTTQQRARNTMRKALQQHARNTKATTTQSNNATQCMQRNTTQQQQHNNNATTCNTTYAKCSPCHDKSNAMPINIELHNNTTNNNTLQLLFSSLFSFVVVNSCHDKTNNTTTHCNNSCHDKMRNVLQLLLVLSCCVD